MTSPPNWAKSFVQKAPAMPRERSRTRRSERGAESGMAALMVRIRQRMGKQISESGSASDVRAALASLDDPARTGHPGGAGRGQEGDDVGHLFGGSKAAERDVLFDKALHAFGVFLLPLPPGAAGRRDCPGGDAVYADVVPCEFESHRFGVADKGGLDHV